MDKCTSHLPATQHPKIHEIAFVNLFFFKVEYLLFTQCSIKKCILNFVKVNISLRNEK